MFFFHSYNQQTLLFSGTPLQFILIFLNTFLIISSVVLWMAVFLFFVLQNRKCESMN